MVVRSGRTLACQLIDNHFGDLVGKVCRCIIFQGPLPLPDIARLCEIPVLQLQNPLLLLVQHNCIQGFKVEVKGFGATEPKIVTSYVAIVENILHRMRFPKFLVVVREDLGEEAGAVIEGLLEHGRLTLEQVIQRAAVRSGKAESEVETSIKALFAKLVRSRYIERCPGPESILPPMSDAKKKASDETIHTKVVESGEKHIISATAPAKTKRFLLPGLFEETTASESVMGTTSSEGSAGQKRKRGAIQMDPNTEAAVTEKEILWRVNYEEFIRRLRHQACVSQVRSKTDVGSAIIFEAMLEATRSAEVTVRPKVSVPLSMDAIKAALRNTAEGRSMTTERISMALATMCTDSLGFLIRTRDDQYMIHFSKVIELARRSEIEGIVLQRYGKETCRIYKVLAWKGPLEQKQISDMVLAPMKETEDTLNSLMKDGYLRLQEVGKAPNNATTKAIYLWWVNNYAIEERILHGMFQAASNFGQKLSRELQREQEALDLLKQMPSSGGDALTPTQNQHERIKRIRNIATLLESTLMKLDDSILLFNDF